MDSFAGPYQPSEGLLQARQYLYQKQAELHHGGSRGEFTLISALAQLGQRRRFPPPGLKLDPELEEKRIALAEDLIRRTDPGPFEDPIYLALLAYQAASIELALPDSIDGRKIDAGWSRFLLGTAHSPEVQAQSWTSSQGYTVVWLDSGLIEFCYQAAKAVIATLHPVTVSGTRVSFEFTDQHIRDELDRNPEPVERLYRTLEAYFFGDGYPRAPGFSQEAVPAEQVIPLTILVDMMERWVLAHEYGHGFATGWGFKNRANETEDVSPARAEEFSRTVMQPY